MTNLFLLFCIAPKAVCLHKSDNKWETAASQAAITIVIPTYNEAANISRLIHDIQGVLYNSRKDYCILVVDDNSSDGTASLVLSAREKFHNVHLIRRRGKMGLGSAYVDGFLYAARNLGAKYVIQMDADLSHDPRHLPQIIAELENGADMVVGSRRVEGGQIIGWSLYRRSVSGIANRLARSLLSLPVRDCTSGYKGINISKFDFDLNGSSSSSAIGGNSGRNNNNLASGFAFQISSLFSFSERGCVIKEIPITFRDRTRGESKLGNGEIIQFLKVILTLFYQKHFRKQYRNNNNNDS
jgi:dolichol-phosphate mannosyltransferase